jgi:hypothetical protein
MAIRWLAIDPGDSGPIRSGLVVIEVAPDAYRVRRDRYRWLPGVKLMMETYNRVGWLSAARRDVGYPNGRQSPALP